MHHKTPQRPTKPNTTPAHSEPVHFWFFTPQDVRLSDKNRYRSFLSANRDLAPDAGSVSFVAAPCRACLLIHAAGNRGVSKTRNSFSLMTEQRNKGGRPRKTEGKRTRKIAVRFTDDELAAVVELEKTLGVSRTELVRSRLLQDARLTIVNAAELIALLQQIGAELGRSGNNINQLAKYANILKKKAVLSPVVFERFNILFEEYVGQQRSLENGFRKTLRMLGK